MHVTTAFISVKALSEKAKLYGATITEYLICHLIESIVEIQKSEIGKKHFLPVKVCVPVNMRKFYPSKTVRNFAQFVNVGISPRFGEYTFQETLSIVRHQMGLFATEKQLNARMSMNVNAERHKLMRIAPLFIKNPAILIAFIRNGDRNSSVTLSNLGIVSLPDEMKKHIEHFDFMLGALSTNPIVVGCISYNDLLCINITRSIKESFFEREFLTRLVKSGIHVKVESNQRF
ncbi:hypothetical protein SDC9_143061 [bioreactor metagenome]|uniref:Alcohol acetyltransferase n=1 Tax=bioreactor metagenome TaxID=1076179 RepID=A0A645E2Z9_9ZZZZ